MAIVINSQFDPFSMQDLWSPLSQVSEAHMKTEAELSNFATEGAAWKNYVNPTRDVQANKLLSSYETEIDNASNLLMKEGLTPSIRKKLLNLKQSYANNIVPISRAVETISQQAKEQRSKGPGYIFDMDMSNVSLDKALENPNISYKTAHLKDIEQTVSGHVAPFATQILTNPKLLSSDTGQYLYSFIQRGYTPEQIVMAIEEGENVPNELKRLIKVRDDVLDSYVKDWNNPEAVSKATLTANSALYDAVGKMSSQILLNREALLDGKNNSNAFPPNPEYVTPVDALYTPLENDLQISKDWNLFNNIMKTPTKGEKAFTKLVSPAIKANLYLKSGFDKDLMDDFDKGLKEYYELDASNKELNQEQQKQLSEMMKRYKVETIKELNEFFNKSMTNRAIVFPTYTLQLDPSAFNDLRNTLKSTAAVFGDNVPIFETEKDGSRGGKISDTNTFFASLENIYIQPFTGEIKGLYIDKTNKRKEVIIDPGLIPDFADNIRASQAWIRHAYTHNDEDTRADMAKNIALMMSTVGTMSASGTEKDKRERASGQNIKMVSAMPPVYKNTTSASW